ncbi:MAG: hypothetical protein AAFY84_07765 [Pseudomonadota bacterium]
MKTKLAISTSLAAIAGAFGLSAGVEWNGSDHFTSTDGVTTAFVSPALISQSICGNTGDAQRRRAFFLKIASAAANPENSAEVLAPVAGRLTPLPSIHYKISTSVPDAQTYFDAGIGHMWNFNHAQAIAAFKEAQTADPACAICFWAESLALGPNINAPMDPTAIPPAMAALTKAQELKETGTEKEKALIDALAARYKEDAGPDRSALDAAFADAMDAVALTYPEDDFIAILSAEANMDTQPWDYWMADGRAAKGRSDRTLSLLEGVLARSPDHQGAIHLYIHLTENTTDPYRAAPYADKLAALSPGFGHLIHMPSHIYYRIGEFKKSLNVNIDGVAADEAFLASGPSSPLYEYGYYTHNVHFLMTSAMMAGDAATSLSMAEKLDDKLPLNFAAEIPLAQPIKAAPYYAKVMFADPEDILTLEKPEDVPFVAGIWHYARGEALARLGRLDEARAEAAAISDIFTNTDLSVLENNNIPGIDVLKIAHLTVLARIADSEGDLETAIEAMEEADILQSGLNYTEPPYWYYPAKQTLAALALKNGETARAEQLFMETLVKSPNNGWALYGLSEAYKAQGDKSAAKFARSMMKDAWLGKKSEPGLSRL